jgi:signal transduction histidine kinase
MLTEEISVAQTANAKASVLVVDDEYGPRESVAFTLAVEFAVETAERASEALAKIRQREYSAIVLDIRMPEMDGIRALEEIRKIDPLVSVIMLTGYGTLLTAQQAIVGGANHYLRKPPDVEELLAAVRQQTKATSLRRHQARLARDAQDMNVALKREIEKHEPQIWQGRASVELVHDLNNPLTVVIGYATLLCEEAKALGETDPERSAKLLDYAGMVEKAAEYCHHLSENWRLSSRKMATMAPLDLVLAARDVQQVIFFGNPAIAISGLAEAPILGSKFELMRIFQNLFKNSLEAGAQTVGTVFSRRGDRVEVVITDNGPGMDADQVRKALQGGFTSKISGTGLGLGICRHLVTAHGGTFEFESSPGAGTKVRLSFPAAPTA